MTTPPESFEVRDRRLHPAAWALHDQMMATLTRQTWIEGGKEYTRCAACGKIVRLNKPVFGSLHLCR